ncbi:MAG: sensor domain-containing diguanylate cyclase [Burkholderiales bacterium]|nr:sensor domain-containing diguanylate cyclase [Burkholderiales bacterium]
MLANSEENSGDFFVKDNLPTHPAMTSAADTPSDPMLKALRASESRYRRLFESARDGILLLNSDTAQIEDVNPYLIELLGYSHAEFLGKKLWEVGPFADRDESKEMFEELQTKGYVRYEDLPLKTKAGAIVPVEFVSNTYDCEGIRIIQCNIRNITERKQMEDHARQMALHDTLTKLPNRQLLSDRLGQAMATCKRSGCYALLIFLDLDEFKLVNDAHGHAVGDLLLIEAGCRLKGCVREVDTVARFGGDEFVVLIGDLDADKTRSRSQAESVAKKIRTALAMPYMLKIQQEVAAETTVELQCTASIGVGLFGKHEASPDSILKRADTAMYQAKKEGGNLIRVDDSTA